MNSFRTVIWKLYSYKGTNKIQLAHVSQNFDTLKNWEERVFSFAIFELKNTLTGSYILSTMTAWKDETFCSRTFTHYLFPLFEKRNFFFCSMIQREFNHFMNSIFRFYDILCATSFWSFVVYHRGCARAYCMCMRYFLSAYIQYATKSHLLHVKPCLWTEKKLVCRCWVLYA